MIKLSYKKLAMLIMSGILALTGSLSSAYAVSDSQVAKDKNYMGSDEVPSTDEWAGYTVNVSFDVIEGVFQNIVVSSPNMANYNNYYKNLAEARIKSIEGKPANLETINAIDTMSSATFTADALKRAITREITNADPAESPTDGNEMVYGKANISFADFYYGELIKLVAGSTDMDLETADKAASLKEAGMYDAVSSVTPNKFKSFYPTTYYMENEDRGGKILGIKDATIAINKKLYEDALQAINEGRTSNNPLLDIVKGFTKLADGEIPTEYKILNGDGTLTETMGTEPTVDENGTATISNINRYGHYGINVKSESLPDIADVDGVILTTEDGKTYGMKHLENIWVRTNEISFAGKANFVEPHGNLVNYMAYKDMQGKRITKIQYVLRNKADLVINTSLLVKHLIEDNQGIIISDTPFANDVELEPNINVPTDSNYTLSKISKRRTVLENGVDYVVDGNKIIFKETEKTGIGGYTATYIDDKYSDIVSGFNLTSGHPDGSVKIEKNKLILPEGIDKDAYYKSIARILIDGKPVRGTEATIAAIFGDDLTADFEAAITHRGNKIPLFTKEGDAKYDIEIISAGYPSVTGVLSTKLEEDTNTDAGANDTGNNGSDTGSADTTNTDNVNTDNVNTDNNSSTVEKPKDNTDTSVNANTEDTKDTTKADSSKETNKDKTAKKTVQTGDKVNLNILYSIFAGSILALVLMGLKKFKVNK